MTSLSSREGARTRHSCDGLAQSSTIDQSCITVRVLIAVPGFIPIVQLHRLVKGFHNRQPKPASTSHCEQTTGMAQVQSSSGIFGATPATTLCCLCGLPLRTPSPNNTCATCVAASLKGVGDRVPKSYTIIFCKNCERYLKPPATWVVAQLESKELMAICLSKVLKLEKARITDAKFIWTEEHSRRIKIRLTAQEQHPSSLQIVQESFAIEYVVQTMQCPDCTRLAAKNTWSATIQVRQKVDHKRTFLFLEQLLLKSQMHKQCSNIKEAKNGVDFQFLHKNQAQQMQAWLEAAVPCKSSWSERVISTDVKSNTRTSKWTCVTTLAPICKEDVVYLPKSTRKFLGGVSPLALCYRVFTLISFIDPWTLKSFTMNMHESLKYDAEILMSSGDLSQFYVIDVEEVDNPHSKGLAENSRHGFKLARITVGRSSDNEVFTTLSHLGNELVPGDDVLAYDFTLWNGADGGDRNEWNSDVILVRKRYVRTKKRNWKLKKLAYHEGESTDGDHMEVNGEEGRNSKKRADSSSEKSKKRLKIERDKRRERTIQARAAGSKPKTEASDADVQRFLEELEEDPEMRQRINVYQADDLEDADKSGDSDDDYHDAPEIPVDELLADMRLE